MSLSVLFASVLIRPSMGAHDTEGLLCHCGQDRSHYCNPCPYHNASVASFPSVNFLDTEQARLD